MNYNGCNFACQFSCRVFIQEQIDTCEERSDWVHPMCLEHYRWLPIKTSLYGTRDNKTVQASIKNNLQFYHVNGLIVNEILN